MPDPRCRGHAVLRIGARVLAGSCEIDGTPAADTIVGTHGAGDVIRAGAGDDVVHARDGAADRVDCGPGRDTVYADRLDRLRGCERVL